MRTCLLLCLCFLAGCRKDQPAGTAPSAAVEPAPKPAGQLPAATVPRASAPPAWRPSDDPRVAKFLGLRAPKPVTWSEQPPQSSMHVADYVVPGRDGHNAAHVVVFHFPPGQGGPVDMNIARWEGQFKPAEDGTPAKASVERFEADGMPVTLAKLEGQWMQMGQTWYTADQVFLGAIVEAPNGKVVIRFAGESATVEANREDFMKLLKGLRREASAAPAP